MEHLEGRQSVLAALNARQRRFEVILLRHGLHAQATDDVIALASIVGVPVRHVDGRELDSMAHGSSHGGVLAVCSPKPRTSPSQLLELLNALAEPPLLLLLEGVDDARNLGFTLRSAESLGAHAVMLKKHLWDFDSVEVARPASGAYERMPLVQIDNLELLDRLRRRGLRLFGCLAGVRRTLHQTDLVQPSILAIGGEKRGLSGAVRSICDDFLTIPGRAGTSSLPLSAAIVLAEAMRQRTHRPA
jgi:23S rRNA (guanosine2251-2'-O)-methyltransferase